MAEPKTRPTTQTVADYLKKIADAPRRDDCVALVKMFKSVVKKDGVMWGSDIVGFGSYTMTYADGRELEWPLTGFSPRKAGLVLYVPGLKKVTAATLKKVGKCKASGGCLHVKSLANVDMKALTDLVAAAVKAKKAKAQ